MCKKFHINSICLSEVIIVFEKTYRFWHFLFLFFSNFGLKIMVFDEEQSPSG